MNSEKKRKKIEFLFNTNFLFLSRKYNCKDLFGRTNQNKNILHFLRASIKIPNWQISNMEFQYFFHPNLAHEQQF